MLQLFSPSSSGRSFRFLLLLRAGSKRNTVNLYSTLFLRPLRLLETFFRFCGRDLRTFCSSTMEKLSVLRRIESYGRDASQRLLLALRWTDNIFPPRFFRDSFTGRYYFWLVFAFSAVFWIVYVVFSLFPLIFPSSASSLALLINCRSAAGLFLLNSRFPVRLLLYLVEQYSRLRPAPLPTRTERYLASTALSSLPPSSLFRIWLLFFMIGYACPKLI